MARSRTIRRSKRKSGIVPDSLQSFIARRFYDGFSALLLLGGLFDLIALLTYDNQDPSWNTTSAGGGINNWMGAPGAFTSDLLLQTLGIGSFALAIGFIVYGARGFKRHTISPLWLRIVALMVSAVLFSVAFAQTPSHGWTVHPFLGSSAGTLILETLTGAAQNISSAFGPSFITIFAGMLASLTFLYACAVTREEATIAAAAVRDLSIYAAAIVSTAASNFIGWVLHYNDPDYQPQARRKPAARKAPRIARMDDEEDSDEETEDEEEHEEEDEEVDAAPARIQPSLIPVSAKPKKKKKEKQASFPLYEGDWEIPPLSLLQPPKHDEDLPQVNEQGLRRNAELLQNVLQDFNVEGDIVSINPGPVVTLYELEPAPGTKTSRVIGLADDIARSMSAISVRCAVVPGRNVIGIELPNKHRATVFMQELLSSRLYENGGAHLPLILGKDIAGEPIMADLAKMPHLLVAGTTGSGKSVAVNTMILSLLFRLPPEKCRFIMIDPKMLELSVYDDIPHLLAPVVTEPGKAVVALKWTVREMEDRYRAMSKLGVRNIEGYNERLREAKKKGETIMRKVQTGFDGNGKPEFEDQPLDLTELPYIVVIVDEFADLMLVAGKDVENAIQRLAQMARAAGIHLIMATQRPSVDVITGVIKANFPTRISFQVTSKIDSRTILGEGGAEQLLGRGDMLYMAPGGRITRVHGPFVSDNEVEGIVKFLKAQGAPSYIDEVTEGDDDFGDSEVMNAMFGGEGGGNGVDELYDQAVAIVAREGKASTSFVQRHLQIGYNRAARIIEEMERQGVISKSNAVGKREVLIQDFSNH